MRQLRVVIGCDHAAVVLKDGLVKDLRSAGVQVEDVGTFSGDPVDYPDFAEQVAGRVASGAADRGIVMCGTGIGVSIAANKIRGVRAALCHDVTTARLARQHNDANVLCMGGRIVGPAVAADIATTWLTTEFEGGRHQRRVDKLRALEGRPHAAGEETKR